VASHISSKHVAALKHALARLLAGRVLSPQDGVLIIPLPDEPAQQVHAIGANNMLAALMTPPLKILL